MIATARAFLRHDATAAILSSAVRSIGRMVATVLIARSAGIEGVATFALAVAVETIAISGLNALFASPAAALSPGRRPELRRAICAFAERAQRTAGLLLCLIAIGVTATGVTSVSFGVFFGLHLAASAMYQARRSTRVAEFRARRVLAAELFIAVTGVATPVVVAIAGHDVGLAFWAGQAVAHAVATLALPATKSARVRSGATRAIRASVLRTGSRMLAGSIAVSLSGRTQPLVLGALLGAPAVGLYGAANAFAAPIRLAAGSARGALLPRFARRNRRPTGRSVVPVGRAVAVTIVASALAVGLATALAPRAVVMVFGEPFRAAAPIVPLLLLHAMLSALTSLQVTVRQAQGQSGRCAAIRWLAALLAPVLMILGGLVAGLLGVIVGLLILEVMSCLLLVTQQTALALGRRCIRARAPSDCSQGTASPTHGADMSSAAGTHALA